MKNASIEHIPESYKYISKGGAELFVHDLKMTGTVVRSKVRLSMHMFSFLQVGKKQVHFTDNAVTVNRDQSLLVKKGNALWTELLDDHDNYYCKLLFFSEEKLVEFLQKHCPEIPEHTEELPYFVIQNDDYIKAYLESLERIKPAPASAQKMNLLSIKFDELMLYLVNKHGARFSSFLHSLISKQISAFKLSVENHLYANLKISEIAFLCHMSLSSFKRHFKEEYKTTPGKWMQRQRLLKAKAVLESGVDKASNIYMEYGYSTLSNFSVAFKNEFGCNPSESYS